MEGWVGDLLGLKFNGDDVFWLAMTFARHQEGEVPLYKHGPPLLFRITAIHDYTHRIPSDLRS